MRTATRCAAAASGLLVSLVMTQAAESQTLKTGYYSVDPAALTTNRTGISYTKGAGVLFNIHPSAECFSTGINLPHRATITRIVVWYKGGTTMTPSIQFVRTSMPDGSREEVAFGNLTNKGAARKAQVLDLTEERAAVDNARYVYGIDFCIPPDGARFYGARVTYTH